MNMLVSVFFDQLTLRYDELHRSGVPYCHSQGKETIFLPRSPSSDIPVSPPRWQKVKQVMAWVRWVFYVLSSPQAK